MMMEYPITMGETVVGKAAVERSGLYLTIVCRCKFKEQKIHRIVLFDGVNPLDLGICVPEGDVFTLRKNVPLKQLSGQTFQFVVDGVSENRREMTEKPSFSIGFLNQAMLRCVDGKWYLFTKEGIRYPVQDLQDSDQNP